MKRILMNYSSKSFRKFIKRLGKLITLVDTKHWGDHNVNVSCLTFALAEANGLPLKECDLYGFAAFLHDFGKLDGSLEFLFRPNKGPYTDEERVLSAQHAEAGVRLLAALLEDLESEGRERARVVTSHFFDKASLKVITDCQVHHDTPYHKGEDRIPLVGRMCRITDAYDAMTAINHCGRKYRKRRTPIEARAELLCSSGTDFDPELVEVFLTKVLAPPPGRGGHRKRKMTRSKVLVPVRPSGKKTAMGWA
jgi:HD-GYP domain-containing protein (c-di-GMP phosphodiesterase class II)